MRIVRVLKRLTWAFALAGLALGGETQAGFLIRLQYWDSLDSAGNQTTDYRDFLNDPFLFPSFPSSSDVLTGRAATPRDVGDDFGSLIRGYIVAPEDGDYTFTVASDDSSGFWLSANHDIPSDFPSQNPTGAREPDAEETGWSSDGIFGALRYDERTTDPVTLSKGDVRYFEMVSQERGGGDFMQLGWTRPDGSQEIIPTLHLLPGEPEGTPLALANGEFAGVDSVNPVSGPNSQTVEEGRSVTFSVDALGGEQPLRFQWRRNGSAIDGATLPFLRLTEVGLDQNGDQFACVVTDAAGDSVTSRSATLTVQADQSGPAIVSAQGSGFPHGIRVSFSESVDPATALDPANYTLSGQSVTVSGVAPVADDEVLLETSSFTTDPLTLEVANVQDVSAAGNPVAAGTSAPVRFRSTLAGYWSFDEGEGERARDLAAGNDGALENGPVWTTDAPSLGRENPFALEFDGVDDYVATPFAGIGGGDPRTVSFWIKADDDSLTTHGIIAWGDSTANSQKYHVRINNGTSTIRTEAQGGNNWATTPITDGVWHHVVSMLPEGVPAMNLNVEHYLDGVLEERLGGADVAIATDITSPEAFPVWIGARDQTGTLQGFPGLIDEVAIFEGGLTAGQIAQLAQGADPYEQAAPIAAPVALDEEPSDASVAENETATFSVSASGSPALALQWFKNGQPVEGATDAAYVTAPLTPADDQAQIHVEVFNSDGTFNRIASRTATLSVQADLTAPSVASVRGLGGGLDRVIIEFDEPLEPGSAANTDNYSIDGVAISGASWDAANRTVTLDAPLTDGTLYSLTIAGVTDTAAAANALNTTIEFTANATFPDQVLEDQPVRYWRFNEGAGASELASQVTGVDPLSGAAISTIQGSPDLDAPSLLSNDSSDSAIRFDGSAQDQVLIAPNGDDINTSVGPWAKKTVEFWFIPSSLPSSDGADAERAWGIFEQGGGDRALSVYLYGTEPGPAPEQADLIFHALNRLDDGAGSPWGDPSIPDDVFVRAPVQADRLYHVVAVMDGDDSDALGGDGRFLGSLRLFLNGEEVDQSSGVGLLYNHTGDIQIGQGDFRDHTDFVGLHGFFNGVIDELALYNDALPADRIQAHYNAAFSNIQEGEVQITRQPQDQTAPENTEADFSVEFTGTPPWTAVWRLNGVELTGAITKGGVSTIAFPVTLADDGGVVTVEVSNDINTVGSREAILSVSPDQTPPQIVRASGRAGSINQVVVRFNEPVDPASAESPSNYSIAGLTVQSASLSADGLEVTLTTSQQTSGADYSLEVGDVRDLAAAGNPVNASASFTSEISYRIEVLADQPDLYFPLGETGGTSAQDIVGLDPAYVGVYTGNAPDALPILGAERVVVGAPDPAVGFDAANLNQIVFNTDSGFVNTGGPYEDKTIELWFKADRLPAAPAAASLPEKMVLFEQGGLTRGISIYLSGTQDSPNPTEADIYFHAWNDNSDGTGSPWGGPEEEGKFPVFVRGAVQLDQAYHAVMLLDGDASDSLNGRIDAYLNGDKLEMPFGENMFVGLLYNHGDNAGVGGINQNAVYHDQNRGVANGDFFSGVIDELAFYGQLLPESRILAHYNQGLIEVPLEQPAEDIVISAVTTDGSSITIEWTGGGVLQRADTVTGVFTTLPGSSSPHTETIEPGQNRFYRVIQTP